jgi:hypothetical protein
VFGKSETLKLTVPVIPFAVPLMSSRGVVLKNVTWFLPPLSAKSNNCVPAALTLNPCAYNEKLTSRKNIVDKIVLFINSFHNVDVMKQ